MLVSLNWLREYVDFDLTPEELGHRLTMAGIELGSIERIGENWENVFVGRVTALAPHPDADRLRLATVDLSTEQLTVVCGAPNVAVGQNIAFAKVGARLTDPKTGETERLKAARIRGVRSEGMVCSEQELGMGDDHSGIIVLPEDAPVGQSLETYMGDTVLELEVTSNRPDCLGMLGVAWEVAAIMGSTVRMPQTDYEDNGTSIAERASAEIVDTDLCSRYTATLVEGLTVGPSPRWMQERLKAVGLRPINNLVDVTNYVLMEYGQPLHAFDFATLAEGKIVVRRAQPQEKMTTIDGEERELKGDDLVIADARVPVALAGIMGGGTTEVLDTTTTVLLESATFSNLAIRRTSAGQRLRTEASLRFEKGLNPELAVQALLRATRLLVEVGGGTAFANLLDAYPARSEPPSIALDNARVRRVLGVEVPRQMMMQAFASLGLEAREVDQDTVEVTPPFWRTDLAIPEDLIEELARTIGYDSIPTTLPSGAFPPHVPDPMGELKATLRRALVGAGMQEAITYSLVSKELLDQTAPSSAPQPIRVRNPLTVEQEYMRTTLRGSLLKTFAANQRTTEGGLRLFELGRTYLRRDGGLPDEREVLAAIIGGPRATLSWQHEEGAMDFFDAKGVLEHALSEIGVTPTFQVGNEPRFHPGRTAGVQVGGELAGLVAEVHPNLLRQLDIDTDPVAYFEIDLATILPHVDEARYVAATRYPGVVRDLAFLVDEDNPSGPVEQIMREFPSVANVTLFDIYTGERVPEGKKSVAFRLLYQNPTRTLTDAEVDIAQTQLLEKVQRETGAVLRG